MKRHPTEEGAKPVNPSTATVGPEPVESDGQHATSVAAAEREVSSPQKDGQRNQKTESPTLALISKVMIPLAGLIVTVGLAFISRYDNRESLQRQLQNQAVTAENQRKLSEAQLAAELIPNIVKGTPEERRSALAILSSAAPLYASRISGALLSSGVSPDKTGVSQAFIEQIEQKSENNDHIQQFKQHLQNARKYRDYEQFNAAGLEYLQAYENIPPAWATSIANQFAEARAIYDRGKFEDAAQKFDEVLGRVLP